MQDWHSTCLGRRTLPRDLSAFEIEAFFNFSEAERHVVEDRRGPALKLALALHIPRELITGRPASVRLVCHVLGTVSGPGPIDHIGVDVIRILYIQRGHCRYRMSYTERQHALLTMRATDHDGIPVSVSFGRHVPQIR